MDGIADLISYIRNYWYRKSTLFTLIFLLPIILIYATCSFKISALTCSQVVFIIFVTLVVLCFWYFTNRMPHVDKEKIGILLAIKADTPELYNIVKNKFITTFDDLLKKRELSELFTIIALTQQQVEKKPIDDATAEQLAIKTNSMIVLYGRCTCGNIKNNENYSIELSGGVRHAPISKELSDKIGGEFGELMPNAIIPKENDLLGFKLYSEQIEIATKYIIGFALVLSGSTILAKNIYEGLYEEVNGIKSNNPLISKVKKKLPMRLGEIYHFLAWTYYNKFRTSRDADNLREFKKYIDLLDNVQPNCYAYLLMSAIYYFLDGRQIKKAKAQILKCKDVKDAAWRYSDAFLSAYEGKLLTAYRKYMKAFKYEYNANLLIDVEIFIKDVLEQEPNKYELYFALGLLNYYYKGDEKLAHTDLNCFIDLSEDNYNDVKGIAVDILYSINSKEKSFESVQEAAMTN